MHFFFICINFLVVETELDATGCLAVVVDLKQGCLSPVLLFVLKTFSYIKLIIVKHLQIENINLNQTLKKLCYSLDNYNIFISYCTIEGIKVYCYRSIVNVHVVITKTTQTARATENPIIHSDICFEDSTNFPLSDAYCRYLKNKM